MNKSTSKLIISKRANKKNEELKVIISTVGTLKPLPLFTDMN